MREGGAGEGAGSSSKRAAHPTSYGIYQLTQWQHEMSFNLGLCISAGQADKVWGWGLVATRRVMAAEKGCTRQRTAPWTATLLMSQEVSP